MFTASGQQLIMESILVTLGQMCIDSPLNFSKGLDQGMFTSFYCCLSSIYKYIHTLYRLKCKFDVLRKKES